MRPTALLSLLVLLPAPLFAQDTGDSNAAEKFFRAFWLEQSGGKIGEAELLYRKLVKQYPDSPEAPRAYLALIRLSAARGVAADDLLRALEKGYPKAKKEIELARKLAARLRTDFDPEPKPTDTPVVRKLKTIYRGLAQGAIGNDDRDFLADIGPVGHPMLAHVLRSNFSGAVKKTADLLAGQRTREANAVLEVALRDSSLLYRVTIVDTIYRKRVYAKSTMKTLRDIWPQASRSMRVRIAHAWAAGTYKVSPSVEECYGYLVLALADEDEEVRKTACNLGNPTSMELRPKSYVAALIPLCRKNDRSVRQVWQWLPWQLGHADLASALTEVLIGYPDLLVFDFSGRAAKERVDGKMAVALASMVVGRYKRRSREKRGVASSTTKFGSLAAASSGEAAHMLLNEGMAMGSNAVTWAVALGFKKRSIMGDQVDAYVPDANKLRVRAIEQAYDANKELAAAAHLALRAVGLRAEDFGAVADAARRHPDKGLVSAAYSSEFLARIGPAKAARLAPLATELKPFYRSAKSWTLSGQPAKEIDDAVFWAAVLPLMKPSDADNLRTITSLARVSSRHADVVARWILTERDAAWGWKTPTSPRGARPHALKVLRAPAVREALMRDPLRRMHYELADDPRLDIAKRALDNAEHDKDDVAMIALRKGVVSPWPHLRISAVKFWARRGAAGGAALVELLKNDSTPPEVRATAIEFLPRCVTKAQLPYVNSRLDQRPGGAEADYLWQIASDLDLAAAAERALNEVIRPGSPAAFRHGALVVLCDVSDARRIPIFRRVLRESSDAYMIHRVLRTVADQYLIELGPEVLLHLRSPNDGIRKTATTAIERLKFYAEAKKLFEEEKKDKDD